MCAAIIALTLVAHCKTEGGEKNVRRLGDREARCTCHGMPTSELRGWHKVMEEASVIYEGHWADGRLWGFGTMDSTLGKSL